MLLCSLSCLDLVVSEHCFSSMWSMVWDYHLRHITEFLYFLHLQWWVLVSAVWSVVRLFIARDQNKYETRIYEIRNFPPTEKTDILYICTCLHSLFAAILPSTCRRVLICTLSIYLTIDTQSFSKKPIFTTFLTFWGLESAEIASNQSKQPLERRTRPCISLEAHLTTLLLKHVQKSKFGL